MVFDCKIKFKTHFNVVITKTYRILVFVKRHCRDFTNVLPIIKLYESMIRSVLEYGCTIWNPYNSVEIDRIE